MSSAKIREKLPDSDGGYLIVVNDITRGSVLIRAPDVVSFLFRKRVWIFRDQAPFLRKFRQGDRLIIYLAGRSGTFVAEARIASEVLPLEAELNEEVRAFGLIWFTRYVRISDMQYLHPPRRIRDLVPKLKFIGDKQNFGLSLRHGARRLERHDVKTILG